MAKANDLWGLSPRAWNLASCLVALAGLAGVVVGFGCGDTALLAVAYPVTFSARLIPALADLHHVNSRIRLMETQATGEKLVARRNIELEVVAGRLVLIEPEQSRRLH